MISPLFVCVVFFFLSCLFQAESLQPQTGDLTKENSLLASCDLHIPLKCSTVEEWNLHACESFPNHLHPTPLTTITTLDCCQAGLLFVTQLASCFFFFPFILKIKNGSAPFLPLQRLLQIRPFSLFNNTWERKDKKTLQFPFILYPVSVFSCFVLCNSTLSTHIDWINRIFFIMVTSTAAVFEKLL